MRKWIVLALAAAVGCRRESGDAIEATGTLEVVEVNVAATVPARIAKINVLEGQVVKAGDTLALLAQPTLPSEERQREARARGARALLQEMERGARPAEMQRAEAELAAAEAEASRTARDAERLRGLAERQVVSAQQYDAARSLAATTASRRDALAATVRLLRDGASEERIRAARAEADAAQASVETSQATERDLVLRAPVSGRVATRNVEPGEVVVAGAPVLTVAEVGRQSVRVFVSQAALSRVNPGQSVRGTLDSYPDRVFSGRVASIATKAEFTPRVALTEKERNDLLFAVKIEFSDTTGFLKAGLPITVHIEAPSGQGPASKAP
jgi:HlyD family secretion protein